MGKEPVLRTTRLLLLCGAIGPVLFVIAFLIEGATRPGYDAVRTTISTLSWGDQGWMQIGAFLLFGVLTLAFAVGIARALGGGIAVVAAAGLLGVAGAGLIVAGLFLTDPIFGYPPTPPGYVAPSLHGTIHNLASLIIFLAIPAACLVLTPRLGRDPGGRGWALFSAVSGVVMLLLLAWFFQSVTAETHAAGAGPHIAGLAERAVSLVGCGWLLLFALKLTRASQRGRPQ